MITRKSYDAWKRENASLPIPKRETGTKRFGNGTKRVSSGWVGGNAGERKVSNSGNVFCNFKSNRFVQYWISRSRYGGKKRTEKKKLMVDCTGEGVLFVEANADVILDQLRDAILPPCPILEEFLFNVPGSDGIVGSPLLLIQVNRYEPRLIPPAKPTPRVTKLLSDIDDQQALRFHVPFIMSYKNNLSISSKQNDPVKVISDAVSKALEYYYPLAGRLRDGPRKKLMVHCTGEGVLFVEANADVTVDQLRDAILPPCPSLDEFLFNVPGSDGILGSPLLLIQVTRLTCGGFIFALRLNHTMCDAIGLVHFLNAVGEIAQGADAPSTPPVWERELLNARDPPRITCTHHEYDDTIDHSHPAAAATAATVQRSFCFGPEEIKALRKHLPPHLSTCSSSFELITACVWKCRTISLEMDPKQIVRLACVVSALGKHNNVCLPPGYYGNTFACPAVVSTAELLCNSSLGYVVELVKKSKAKRNEEYFKSVADFMEIKGRPPLALGGISDFVVSDNTRTGLGEIDFGWGKPIYAAVAKSNDLMSFYVRNNNQEENYGILVPICLPLSSMERFQQELKRMTS